MGGIDYSFVSGKAFPLKTESIRTNLPFDFPSARIFFRVNIFDSPLSPSYRTVMICPSKSQSPRVSPLTPLGCILELLASSAPIYIDRSPAKILPVSRLASFGTPYSSSMSSYCSLECVLEHDRLGPIRGLSISHSHSHPYSHSHSHRHHIIILPAVHPPQPHPTTTNHPQQIPSYFPFF